MRGEWGYIWGYGWVGWWLLLPWQMAGMGWGGCTGKSHRDVVRLGLTCATATYTAHTERKNKRCFCFALATMMVAAPDCNQKERRNE